MRKLVIGMAVLACVAGCSSGPDESPKAEAKTPDTTISVADAPAMKEGRDYDVVAKLPAKIDGARPQYLGVSPDGMVFGKVDVEDPNAKQPVGPGSTLLTARSSVFLLDPATNKVTEVLDGSTRKELSGVVGIDADEKWVVWLESPEGGMASGRWTLYSYERSTKKTRKLGAYDDDGVLPKAELEYLHMPAIIGDDAVMATFVPGRKNAQGKSNQVLSAPLDGGAPLTEVARGASSVDADNAGISYVDVTGALVYRDAASGETTSIDDKKSQCRSYRSGVLVTCSSYDLGTKFQVKPKGDAPVAFGPFAVDIAYIEQEPGWVRFVADPDGSPAIYAIDTDRTKLFKVADTQGGWDLMGSDMVLMTPFNGAKGDIKLVELR